MTISYNWLQSFFKEKLPAPEKVAELLTMHSFEVESFEKKGDDTAFEIAILPNRAHDCLSHSGVARELAALLKLPIKNSGKNLGVGLPSLLGSPTPKLGLLIKIEDEKLCRRYIGWMIENVKVGPSPDWLRERLESIGQKSINNVVDVTNYVMFHIGQPMHAFDTEKLVSSEIIVRKAREGEQITTLDKKEVTLFSDTLVIADEESVLAVAGIKGGTKAEVDESTKNIILESANFEPSNIRKTSRALGIRTESSLRFEQEIASSIAEKAMDMAIEIILEIAGGSATVIGEKIDAYPRMQAPHIVSVSREEINSLLGTELLDGEIKNIFERLGFTYKIEEERFVVTAPEERLDIRISHDVIEEIGRIYGYEKIAEMLPKNIEKEEIEERIFYSNVVRAFLAGKGFSEVYTYTFVGEGDAKKHIELENPLALDRSFLRHTLADEFKEKFKTNAYYADLLGIDIVRIFEIGTVFSAFGGDGEMEKEVLGIGVKIVKKSKKVAKAEEMLTEIMRELFFELGLPASFTTDAHNIQKDGAAASAFVEIPLDAIIAATDKSTVFKKWDERTLFSHSPDVSYKSLSKYPFVVRDIALFVPESVVSEEPERIIREVAGPLLARLSLFDTFLKDGKKSFAFRLVFQSHEKTLSDEEVNSRMNQIYQVIKKYSWELR